MTDSQSSASQYEIQPGDTLSRIALEAYGDARRYLEIYEYNKEIIGPNPARLKPGLVITIPEPDYISTPRSLFKRGTVGKTFKVKGT
jgi:nucleoid-associated protein YgaU